MRLLRIVALLVVFTVIGVGITQAHPASDNGIPVFDDGRVNNWTMDEPVAIYCIFDHPESVNVGVFDSIQVWGLNSNVVLQATAAQIDAATAKLGTKVSTETLDAANGYTLTEGANETFTVSAPNGYSFSWARGDTDC